MSLTSFVFALSELLILISAKVSLTPTCPYYLFLLLLAYRLHLDQALRISQLLSASISLWRDNLLFPTRHELCLFLICVSCSTCMTLSFSKTYLLIKWQKQTHTLSNNPWRSRKHTEFFSSKAYLIGSWIIHRRILPRKA